MEQLTAQQILDAGLDDWRQLAQALHARFLTGDFVTGLRFVTSVTEVAEQANHHPDVTLTFPCVDVKLVSHDVSRVTQRDIDLARRISEIAREQGIGAEPSVLTEIELALDTAELAASGPFWSALLTGSPDADEMPRQRFHVDLWVPHDLADKRIAAAVAAGGQVVDDSEAPSFVVLADPEGNKACVCTCLDRGGAPDSGSPA
jgi:4a-hydroxytetrahydrobiopterin dehydratase